MDKRDLYYIQFYQTLQEGLDKNLSRIDLSFSIQYLVTAVWRFFGKEAVLFIDEYDQPVLSSYENGYRDEMGEFFSAMYGSALKGNEYVSQALLTGIQRVAKESIFSKLNNLQVYSVVCEDYAECFGMTEDEVKEVLDHYGLELTKAVKQKYNGYQFCGIDIYNPWSVLNYAKNKKLGDYWVNTSTNYLVRQALNSAGNHFRKDFDRLIEEGVTTAGVNLETSFMEVQDTQSLWGLYKVTSNLEMGLGRSDILLEALHPGQCHILIEFKQGVDLVKLKKEALGQIMENRYYAGLKGRVLCLGIAHNKKECDMVWEYV